MCRISWAGWKSTLKKHHYHFMLQSKVEKINFPQNCWSKGISYSSSTVYKYSKRPSHSQIKLIIQEADVGLKWAHIDIECTSPEYRLWISLTSFSLTLCISLGKWLTWLWTGIVAINTYCKRIPIDIDLGSMRLGAEPERVR